MIAQVGNNVVKCCNREWLHWCKDRSLNELLVRHLLGYCYDKFRIRGYLFLYEVYQELDFPLTKQSLKAGWVFDKEHEDDYMWTIWTKNDNEADVYITFEPIEDITYILPEE